MPTLRDWRSVATRFGVQVAVCKTVFLTDNAKALKDGEVLDDRNPVCRRELGASQADRFLL
jgi:hypothetical protein